MNNIEENGFPIAAVYSVVDSDTLGRASHFSFRIKRRTTYTVSGISPPPASTFILISFFSFILESLNLLRDYDVNRRHAVAATLFL